MPSTLKAHHFCKVPCHGLYTCCVVFEHTDCKVSSSVIEYDAVPNTCVIRVTSHCGNIAVMHNHDSVFESLDLRFGYQAPVIQNYAPKPLDKGKGKYARLVLLG